MIDKKDLNGYHSKEREYFKIILNKNCLFHRVLILTANLVKDFDRKNVFYRVKLIYQNAH